MKHPLVDIIISLLGRDILETLEFKLTSHTKENYKRVADPIYDNNYPHKKMESPPLGYLQF